MVKLDCVSKHVRSPLLSRAAQHCLDLILVQALEVLQGEHSIEPLPAYHTVVCLPQHLSGRQLTCSSTSPCSINGDRAGNSGSVAPHCCALCVMSAYDPLHTGAIKWIVLVRTWLPHDHEVH